ncbi:hypothetical protein BDV3_004796 [Batrachochytrium dendrobatidis]
MGRSGNKGRKTSKTSSFASQNKRSDSDSEDGHSEISHATMDSIGSHPSQDTSPSMTRGGSQQSLRDEPFSFGEECTDSTFLKAFEDLGEKRASVRETALNQIIKGLSNKYRHDLLDGKMSSWIDPVKRCARRDGPEGILANRVLSLLWISGGSQPAFYDDVIKILQDGIRDGSSEIKPSSIIALAIISLIEDMGDSATWELLDYFEDVISAHDEEEIVIHAAVEAYGLLYPSASTRQGQEGYNRILDAHVELLESDDVDVRIAAGENIAIVIEDRMATAEEDEAPKTEPYYESKNELLQQLRFLSQDSQRHRAKKERSVQKSAFRDILNTVESNTTPLVKLKIKQETLECNSWIKIRRLNALRDAIGEGFSVHLSENQTVQQILHLSFDGPTMGKVTSTDRRLFQSIIGKARTKALKEMRGSRTSLKIGNND